MCRTLGKVLWKVRSDLFFLSEDRSLLWGKRKTEEQGKGRIASSNKHLFCSLHHIIVHVLGMLNSSEAVEEDEDTEVDLLDWKGVCR